MCEKPHNSHRCHNAVDCSIDCPKSKELQEQINDLEEFIGGANFTFLQSEMLNMELEQVFAACVDAMLVVNEECKIVRANKQMLKLLNKPADEVVGHQCKELLTEAECDFASAKKKHQQLDIDLVGSAGDMCSYILTTSKLITLDGMTGTLLQYKDITDRKQASRELAEAHAAMAQLARIDGLTQLPNRRTFDKEFADMWQSHRQNGWPLTIIMCDIDFFKKYNDTYGHQAGDDCLVSVAQALQGGLRPGDGGLVARYGGEEFIFLLPQCDVERALAIAENGCREIEGLRCKHESSEVSMWVTLSLGVATIVPGRDNAAALLKLADNALYEAKESGRNKVAVAAVPHVPEESM